MIPNSLSIRITGKYRSKNDSKNDVEISSNWLNPSLFLYKYLAHSCAIFNRKTYIKMYLCFYRNIIFGQPLQSKLQRTKYELYSVGHCKVKESRYSVEHSIIKTQMSSSLVGIYLMDILISL